VSVRCVLSIGPQRTILAERFVKYNGSGGRKIQTAYRWDKNRNPDGKFRILLNKLRRQPLRLFAENQKIAGLEASLHINLGRFFGRQPETSLGMVFFQLSKGFPAAKLDGGPIVQTGTPEMFIVQGKTEGFNKMQKSARGGAQAGNIPRVGRYFRFDKNNLEKGGDQHAIHASLDMGGFNSRKKQRSSHIKQKAVQNSKSKWFLQLTESGFMFTPSHFPTESKKPLGSPRIPFKNKG